MKAFSTFQRRKFTEGSIHGCLLLFALCLLFGCDNGSSFNPSSEASETASASFTISWHEVIDIQPPEKTMAIAQAQTMDCSLIDTIECEVYDESGNDLTTATFDCSAGEGTITGITVGSEREVVALARGGGNILFRGEIFDITILPNQTNYLGEIVVHPFFVDDEDRSPADTSSLTAEELSFQWGVVENAFQYNLVVSTDDNLDEVVLNLLTADTTYTPSDLLDPGTYYWMVLPIDAHLNQGAESSVWSFSVVTDEGCSYSISPVGNSFSPDAGTGAVSVTASADDCTWSASESAGWITITSGAGGSGSGTVTYSVSANASGKQRTAVITVAGLPHTVTQEGVCSYSISPVSKSFSSDAGTGTISVSASAGDCTWSASVDAEWVTITSGDEGSGSGTVTYSVSANTAGGERTAVITAAGLSHTITQEGAPLPDLVITSGSPEITPSTVTPGEYVTINYWTVQNQGTAASGPFLNGYYLSADEEITAEDIYLGGNSNSSLNPGASYIWKENAVTIPQDTADGTYFIGILVDRAGAVSESNESNNYVSTMISVVSYPDLVITSGSPTVTPSSIMAGGSVSLSGWTVTNQGTAASGFFNNGFYLSTDVEITTKDIYLSGNSNLSLAPGESFNWGGPTLTIPSSTAPGTYYIGILVDRTGLVPESNENNNYISTMISVVSYPDLVITSALTVTPSSVMAGGSVSLSGWTVTNQGTAASGFFNNGFYLSTDSVITAKDIYLTGNSNLSLAPGESFNWGGPTLTIPSSTAPGTYYIGILVDRTGAVTESNEGNNYVSTMISVVSYPDLVITSGSPTVTPTFIGPGSSVSLSGWTVKNQGTAASGTFYNGFYLSTNTYISTADTYLGGNSNSSLNPGVSYSWGGPTLTIPSSTAAGTYYIGILVDRTGAVTESNEGNNFVVSGPIEVYIIY